MNCELAVRPSVLKANRIDAISPALGGVLVEESNPPQAESPS